jgi:hypothetical protein
MTAQAGELGTGGEGLGQHGQVVVVLKALSAGV